jgi:hypothetical protein
MKMIIEEDSEYATCIRKLTLLFIQKNLYDLQSVEFAQLKNKIKLLQNYITESFDHFTAQEIREHAQQLSQYHSPQITKKTPRTRLRTFSL